MLACFSRGQSLVSVLSLVTVSVLAACGGSSEVTKTPAVETAKTAAPETKSAPPVDEKKAAEVKTDKPAPKEDKPALPKERFALPNIEIRAAADKKPVKLNGKEIIAEACLMDTSVPDMQSDWFSDALRHMVMAPDGSIYVTDQDKNVRHYIPEPGETCKLAIDPNFGNKGIMKFPEAPERLSVLTDGTLVVMGFEKTHKYVGGKVETSDCRIREIAPDGKTAFYYFVDQASRIDIAGGCKETPWKYTGWELTKEDKAKDSQIWGILKIRPWEKDLLMLMTLRGSHYIGVQGQDGKLKRKLGKDSAKDKNVKEGESICHATDVSSCAGGICLIDSNCKRLSIWDPQKGALVDTTDIGDVLGIFMPWPVAIASAAKGTTYIGVTAKEPRGDKPMTADSKEISHAVIFRVKGLN